MSTMTRAVRLFLAALLVWAPMQAEASMWFDPNGTGKLRPGLRQGVATGVVAPAVTLNGLTTDFGDSRMANGGGYSLTQLRGAGAGYGLYAASANNRVLYGFTGSYGVGASSSRNGRLRITSIKNSSPTSTANGGNSAGDDTGRPADYYWNQAASGEYSPLTDPASAVYQMYSTNDAGNSYFGGIAPTPLGSMNEITYDLDQFQQAGKFVFLANETPTGWAYRNGEVDAVSSGVAQASLPSAAASPQFTDRGVVNADTGQVYSKVSTLTAAGQYTVSASGAYGFYSGDAIARAQISYYYMASLGAAGAYRNTMHNWLSSASASPFVDPDSGVSYPVAGALYNRAAYVESVDTWGATKDPSTSGANTTNLPGTLGDGLHPNLTGQLAAGPAYGAALTRRFPSAQPRDKRPTGNSVLFATANGNTSTFGPTALPTVGFGSSLTPGATRVIVGGALSPADTNNGDGTGTIAGSNFTGTVTYSTRLLKLVFTANPAVNVRVYAASDNGANYLENGLFDPSLGSGSTTATGANLTGTSSIPKGYTMTVDSALQTALNNGFKIALSNGTNPTTNLPELIVSFSGVLTGTGGTGSSITLSAVTYAQATRVNSSISGDRLRASAVIRCLPGADGHSYGTTIPTVKATLGTSAAVTRAAPGTPTTTNTTGSYTIVSASVAGPLLVGPSEAAGLGLDDAAVSGTNGLTMPLVTAPVDASGMTVTSAAWTAIINVAQGKYVSGSVAISQAALQNNPAGL